MSNDWWSTPSRTSTSVAPIQTSLVRSQSLSKNRARFEGDELDPEDFQAAEGIKFLPSFASSQAGKMTLGTSPTGGMTSYGGFGAGSPGERRSPSTRLATSVHDNSSPRHTTRARSLAQSGALAGGVSNYTPDEDMPPTASLRDSVSESRPAPVVAPVEFPTPPALIPFHTSTTLHVFGPPNDILCTLKPYLSQFGAVVSYHPGPQGSNWWTVEYNSPLGASHALRRHGDIIGGRYMIGFKVAGGGSMAGCTLVEREEQDVTLPGEGTPIKVHNLPIMKPKVAPVVVKAPKHKKSAYDWDAVDEPAGWSGWVAEKLFGKY
ncbi:hypothetical protein L204_102590 [Cryptococcus depauperatus]|nr:hypothetical protein L204_00658 [Cryptococcus depauperatus CBS 7855]